MPSMLSIAIRIRNLQSELKVTLAELADLFGVTEITVWNWKHSKKMMLLRNQRTLERLERNHQLKPF